MALIRFLFAKFTPSEFHRWHETYADAHESATVGALDAPIENRIAFLIKVRDQTNDK